MKDPSFFGFGFSGFGFWKFRVLDFSRFVFGLGRGQDSRFTRFAVEGLTRLKV